MTIRHADYRDPLTAGSPAVIFDLDGTLLDTLPDLHGSLNRALSAFGLPGHSPGAVKAMVGNGIARLVRDSVPEGRREEGLVREVRAAFRRDYAAHQLDLTRPYPGIAELLAGISGMGWPMAVLSNKDHENSVAVTDHYFPGLFKVVLGASPSRKPKPDTGGAREAAEILRRAPRDIFFIGDGENDMLVAAACGFTAVGAGWGFRRREDILAAGAGTVMDSPGEFLGIWEGLRGPAPS
ncbi:MAG: HAD family hydrolase [Deltaproteobacteria bacterium]|jgi:phosphoglycolate phosphatase|nr:HAD family hydrolase [Deltaproteobacteria bacterium]